MIAEIFGGRLSLPSADIPYLRDLSDMTMRYYSRVWDAMRAREFFFRMGLVGFYDCMWDGMRPEVGHILYRLSDHVEAGERVRIKIYPGEEKWITLEDWRAEWQRLNPVIPLIDFIKEVETEHLLLSQENNR